MPSGTLGQAAPLLYANTTVYTVPVSKIAVATVSICNVSSQDAKIRLAVSAGENPDLNEYLEYDTTIPVSGVLERTGIVMSASKRLVVNTQSGVVAVNVYGYEE